MMPTTLFPQDPVTSVGPLDMGLLRRQQEVKLFLHLCALATVTLQFWQLHIAPFAHDGFVCSRWAR